MKEDLEAIALELTTKHAEQVYHNYERCVLESLSTFEQVDVIKHLIAWIMDNTEKRNETAKSNIMKLSTAMQCQILHCY